MPLCSLKTFPWLPLQLEQNSPVCYNAYFEKAIGTLRNNLSVGGVTFARVRKPPGCPRCAVLQHACAPPAVRSRTCHLSTPGVNRCAAGFESPSSRHDGAEQSSGLQESAPTSDLRGLVKVKCLLIVEFMDLFVTSVQKMCCLLGFSHLVKCCLQKICVFGPGFSYKPCGLCCASVRGRVVFRTASLVWPRALRAGAILWGLRARPASPACVPSGLGRGRGLGHPHAGPRRRVLAAWALTLVSSRLVPLFRQLLTSTSHL